MVVDATWGAEHHMGHHLLYHLMLVHGGASAVAAHRLDAASHVAENGVGLQGEFAPWHNHYHLDIVGCGVDTVSHGQEIGKCLARTCRRQYHDVVGGAKDCSCCLLLHFVEVVNPQPCQYFIYVYHTLFFSTDFFFCPQIITD